MPDIFISYSRKDSVHALELAERLRAGGMGVWIDQKGIVGAEQWATEIVQGIRACSTFIILLSPDSVISENVLKELSLASEKRKRILPVELVEVALPSSFEYSLAGLQRVAISDFEGILRAHKHGVSRVAVKDSRTFLIVLPFEDLSPADEDNAWFADGLAGEMIDAFGHIKSLHILDRKTSLGLRGTKLRTVEIGREFNTRYFIEGSVRKFGEQIKISVALLDIETGDYLWQESHRGEFKDIFDIQEAVAEKVVIGLKLHLTKEEKTFLQEHGTENAEAYKLYLKGNEYFARATKEGYELAIQLFDEAVKLDSDYANAYLGKADVLANLYRNYVRDPALLDEGQNLIAGALRLNSDLWRAYGALSHILLLQGNLEDAEQTAIEYVRNAPDDFRSHSALGFFYYCTGQNAKAISPYEQSLKLNRAQLSTLFNIVYSSSQAGEENKQELWSEVAIPFFERHLKLFPDDDSYRVFHAGLLHFAGRDDEAKDTLRKLENLKDGFALYNTACLQCNLKDYGTALKTFHKAIKAGFRNMQCIDEFLNNEDEGIGTLKGTPEYEEVKLMVQNMEREPGLR